MVNPTVVEPILEPELPIVDAHHHLWVMSDAALSGMDGSKTVGASIASVYRRHARYLLDELLADVETGHNVVATVYNDARAMYRTTGPELLRSVGEVEFVNGVAAMAASGAFGNVKVCAGIVGGVDLGKGDQVKEVLEAHIRAGGDRYRGVRTGALYDEDITILGGGVPHVLLDETFRAGYRHLQPLGLSFDALVLEPQLPDLIDLARAFPETQIVLNHFGFPMGTGRYTGKREERFPIWRESMRTLASCGNVAVKLGGIGVPFSGFPSMMSDPPASSEQLANEWKPYIETCVELFGADRCMFESNFPVDHSIGSYATVWNTFKRAVAGASASEKTALFSGTATKIYKLEF